MADTYSPLLRFVLQEALANRNLWGNIFNGGVIDLLDEALGGTATVDVTAGNVELATQNGAIDNSRPMFLLVTGTPIAARTVTVPTLSKLYVVINNTGKNLLIKTAASASLTILSTTSSCMLFVDSVNNRIRTIGRANAIVPMSDWTTFNNTFNNESGGPTNIACKYAKQGHLVFFEVPSFTVTTDGTLVFTNSLPADIRPGTAIGLPDAVQYPVFINGAPANVEFAFTAQSNGLYYFTNIGTASVSNPDTYTFPFRSCFVWSTRGP